MDILVEADTVSFDRDIGLRVRGLAPGAEAAITIVAVDGAGESWWSQNIYLTDEQGAIDLALQEPVRGTYSGAHSMGPFWSMVGGERFHTSSSTDVRIRVSSEGRVVGERTVRWLSPRDHPRVTKVSIRRAGLVADLYLPDSGPVQLPVVAVLGGSGGGFNSERASLLATHGYAALDIAYFGVEGTPAYFVETMPLEYFMGAVTFLEQHPRIDPYRIAVMGKSYGAQLALLLASHEPRVRLVVAEAPSSFVSGTPATYPVGPVLSAWSLDGRPFPFLHTDRADPAPVSPAQISVTTSGELALEEVPKARAAAIEVEQINGPVLLITGEADRLWASTYMAEQLIDRVARFGFEHDAVHLSYPDAGHNLGGGEQAYGIPNLPPKDRADPRGGTRQGNSVAGVAAWEAVLAFLDRHLR